MRTRFLIQLTTVVSLATAPALHAQTTRPVSIDIAGGATLSQGSGVLFNGLAGIGVKLPNSSLGLRFDGMYTAGLSSVYARGVTSLTANLVVPFASDHAVSPYLIGGPGLYATPGTGVHAGGNAGAGINFRVNNTQLFVESRFHAYTVGALGNRTRQTNYMIPLSIGLRF